MEQDQAHSIIPNNNLSAVSMEQHQETDPSRRLPAEVMDYILYLMPMKDCLTTVLVSKRWLWQYRSRSLLRFDRSRFETSPGTASQVLIDNQFNGIVAYNLRNMDVYERGIRRFELRMLLKDPYMDTHTVNGWISAAIPITKEVLIDIRTNKPGTCFPLAEVRISHTLRILRLCGIWLPTSFSDVGLSCLEDFSIRNCFVDDEGLDHIIGRRKWLQKIEIRNCYGVSTLQVEHLPSLKRVSINQIELSKAISDTLSSLYVAGPWNWGDIQMELSMLTKLCLTSTSTSSEALKNLVLELPFLECLELIALDVESIELSSTCLKRLRLDMLPPYTDVTVTAPSLVCYKGFGEKSILLYDLEAQNLRSAYMNLSTTGSVDTEYFQDLWEYLTRFKHDLSLSLSAVILQVQVNLEDLKGRSPLPIKHLQLAVCSMEDDLRDATTRFFPELKTFLDAVFLIFLPRRLTVIFTECVSLETTMKVIDDIEYDLINTSEHKVDIFFSS